MEENGQRYDVDGNLISLYDRSEKRPEESGDFKPVEDIAGEEFLAVRPWLGQFKDPSNRNPSFPPYFFKYYKHLLLIRLLQIKLLNLNMSTDTDALISATISTTTKAMRTLFTV